MATTITSPAHNDDVGNNITIAYITTRNNPKKFAGITVDGEYEIVEENVISCSGQECSFPFYLEDGAQNIYINLRTDISQSITLNVNSGTGEGGESEITGTVDISTGMTAEQMSQIGSAIVLTLVVAACYRILKDFLFNRR